MGRRVIVDFISLRDESGCDVENDNEDFRKSNEGVPEMFVILFGRILYRRNRKYFSNEQQKGDQNEDMISVSDPIRIFASDIVLTVT